MAFLVFHPATPGTVYCSDANLHLSGNDFGANVVGFALIMYLTLAGVSFKTLFLLPLTMPS